MPISVVQEPATAEEIIAVPHTIEVPARSVMLITAQVKGVAGLEGLVEPLNTSQTGILKNIQIARALARTRVLYWRLPTSALLPQKLTRVLKWATSFP